MEFQEKCIFSRNLQVVSSDLETIDLFTTAAFIVITYPTNHFELLLVAVSDDLINFNLSDRIEASEAPS